MIAYIEGTHTSNVPDDCDTTSGPAIIWVSPPGGEWKDEWNAEKPPAPRKRGDIEQVEHGDEQEQGNEPYRPERELIDWKSQPQGEGHNAIRGPPNPQDEQPQ